MRVANTIKRSKVTEIANKLPLSVPRYQLVSPKLGENQAGPIFASNRNRRRVEDSETVSLERGILDVELGRQKIAFGR